jgi:hypothetical protein
LPGIFVLKDPLKKCYDLCQKTARISMNRTASLLLVFVSMSLSAVIAGKMDAQAPSRAPDGGTSYRVEGIDLLPLPGMPLTGKSNIEWTRTLEDGSTVTVHLEANLARDSAGHMYRERRSFVPANSSEQPRLNEIMLFDPAARTKTTCTLATKKCVVVDYSPRREFVLQNPGSFAHDTRFLAREGLGENTISGMSVVGTRETTTINAGVVGNESALVSTREFWYSAAIRTNLLVTRNDPREGKQTIALTDLSLAEPDPRTFEVPEGYTVLDQRVPARALR